MSEVIGSPDSEVEIQNHGQITVIFDKHINQKEFDEGLPMWRPAVYEAVAKLKPFVIAVDSLQPGFTFKDIQQMTPVNDLSLLEPGTHMIGADRTKLWPMSDDPKVNQDDWEKIMNAVIKFDPDFDPGNESPPISEMIRQQFAVEESVVSVGLIALTARILWRVHKNWKVGHQPPFTRRDFLKLAGGLAASGAFLAARRQAFFMSMGETQVTDGTPTIPQTLALATKPLFYTDPWVDIRNAQLGVAVMSKFNHPGWSKKSAVITLGNAHGIGEYPGQKSGETLNQAINRLLDVMRGGFKEIERNNQAGKNIVPPEVMKAALIEIFATRDTYLLMKLNWALFDSDLVPEVVKVIDEVLELKNH